MGFQFIILYEANRVIPVPMLADKVLEELLLQGLQVNFS